MKKIIREAQEQALNHKPLSRETIIKLLEIDPESKESEELGEAARRVAKAAADNTGKVWASIGVDYKPCPMNCDFCSFGEKWGATSEAYTLSDEDVLFYVEKFVNDGADFITLRTTEAYPVSGLIALAKKIKTQIPGDYQLVANTSEENVHRIGELKSAGFSVVYHSIRLGEGTNTPFDPKERSRTLKQLEDSGLSLAFLVEPIGPEHTNEEIADLFITAMVHQAKLTGAMARVPIEGTPLFKLGALSEKRLAQIMAVTRLGAGYSAPDICVHPPSRTAIDWGANVVVVDVGAVPRNKCLSKEEWQGFDVKTAKNWFAEAGYTVQQAVL